MSTLRRIASRIDDGIDRLRLAWRSVAGIEGEVVVHPHYGWGTPNRLTVPGHVQVRGDGPLDAEPGDDLLSDIRATIARYVERGVMGARVRASVEGGAALATTDSDGFFAADLTAPASGVEGVHWRKVNVLLEHVPGGRQQPLDWPAEVMVVPAGTDFGIITDVDDTVMKTGIHDFRRNWRQVIESDPALREAFPGLPELYRALAFRGDSVQRRPIFYVSSAAWGFFDLFAEVIDQHSIPQGPLFLKNYGLDADKWFSGGHSDHKTAAIERIFADYPALSFILVGDSGQHDAMIYRDIVAAHPGRVRAVWIRDVADRNRDEVERLIAEVNEAGVPSAFGPDLLVAAREAAARGWIVEGAVGEVERAVEAAAED